MEKLLALKVRFLGKDSGQRSIHHQTGYFIVDESIHKLEKKTIRMFALGLIHTNMPDMRNVSLLDNDAYEFKTVYKIDGKIYRECLFLN